MKNDELNNGIE